MKTFKYRWRLKGQEITGSRDAESRDQLQAHVKNVGGEFIEILSEEEKVIHAYHQRNPYETSQDRSYESPFTNAAMKKCPFCAEDILKDATVCKHCGKELCEREGWGQIGCGALLLVFASLITILLACVLGPLAFIIFPIIMFIGWGLVGSGVIQLFKPVKRKGL
jgi:hypothetical protein